MAKRNQIVNIRVDKLFFDNWFEPNRIKLQKLEGTSFSQKMFTAYIYKHGLKLKLPKLIKNGGE